MTHGADSREYVQTLITKGTRPLFRFIPGDPATVHAVEGYADVFQRSGFPDGRRYLVSRLASDPMQRNVVLDASGNVVKRLDGTFRDPRNGQTLRFFSACSPTFDGRYVCGFCEIDTPGGDNIARAPVFLVSMFGDSRLPLTGAPDATTVECSQAGPWIGMEALEGGLYVGRWSVTP